MTSSGSVDSALVSSEPTREPKVELHLGIFKLIEECGELLTILGKLGAYPTGPHPDERYSKPIRERLVDELADVLSSVTYYVQKNLSDDERATVQSRIAYKLGRYEGWQLSGVKTNGFDALRDE